MKILVQDHYGFKKIYEGSPMDVEHGLLRDFQWLDYLKSYNMAHNQRLRTMLQVLGRAQIYEVKVLDNLMADGIEYDSSLYKAVHHDDMENFQHYLPDTMHAKGLDYDKEHIDTSKESSPHKTLQEAYKKHVIDAPERVSPDFQAHRELGGATAKTVFRGIPSHLPDGSDFMVKPYTSPSNRAGHTEGWQEMTSQALYHAVGLGDYHQRVHVEKHPVKVGGPGFGTAQTTKEVPALVIHMEPGYETMDRRLRRYDVKPTPDKETNKEVAKKMFLLDFVSNQNDRHEGNLMVHQETGKPMLIDNGYGFYYGGFYNPIPNLSGEGLNWKDFFLNSRVGYGQSAFRHLAPIENEVHHSGDYDKHFRPALDWWKEQSPKIRGELANRLSLIQDPIYKESVRKGFNDRAAILDKWANEGMNPEIKQEVKPEIPVAKKTSSYPDTPSSRFTHDVPDTEKDAS